MTVLRRSAAVALLATASFGCGVSANAGVCGAAVSATANAAVFAGATAAGDDVRAQRALADLQEAARHAGESTTGPAAAAAQELLEVAERVADQGAADRADATDTVRALATNVVNLCRDS